MNKRKKSQLNAIAYAYAAKNRAKYWKDAEVLEINYIFKFQKVYKTIGGFVNGYGSTNFKKAVKNAAENAQNRKKQLESCGCKSEKLTDCKIAILQIENLQKNLFEGEKNEKI